MKPIKFNRIINNKQWMFGGVLATLLGISYSVLKPEGKGKTINITNIISNDTAAIRLMIEINRTARLKRTNYLRYFGGVDKWC